MFSRFLFLFSLVIASLSAANDTSNVLIYGDNVQVSSEVNISLNLQAGQNIPVSIMVTHNKNNPVDNSSFKLGNKTLLANFLQNVSMPSDKDIVVSVYQTQLEGLPAGNHVLPSISVMVGGKVYVAPPLTLIINSPSPQ